MQNKKRNIADYVLGTISYLPSLLDYFSAKSYYDRIGDILRRPELKKPTITEFMLWHADGLKAIIFHGIDSRESDQIYYNSPQNKYVDAYQEFISGIKNN